MNFQLFQSDKGDCFLVTGKSGNTILADGGMSSSYTKHVAPTLGKIARKRQPIDLVYVSHIDQDHISGILRMMDDEMDWRVYDFQRQSGNTKFKKPRSIRPPKVKSIWHNAFQDQVGKHSGPIEDVMVLTMPTLFTRVALAGAAEEYDNLITSKREALLLSNRVGSKQLNIPTNKEYGGRLMYVTRPSDSIKLGRMKITVIGPFADELENLRKDWDEWLRKHRESVQAIRDRARRDGDLLTSEGRLLPSAMVALTDELGSRDAVTLPNLASLMLLVEEDGKAALLTGDGHGDDVLDGLRTCGKLDANDRIHVNVLKVQHHGSENNLDAEFCKAVTADHYVFCGNGAHDNPDLRVLKAIIASRLGRGSARSGNAQAGRAFKFWFNSSAVVTPSKNKAHMRKVEKLVKDAASKSNGKMKYRFLTRGSKLDLNV